MRPGAIATIASALCLTVGAASASSIGVYFAPDASDCDATVPIFTQGNLYIIALLGGDAAAGGLTSFEFRLDGFPAGWFPTVTPFPCACEVFGGPLSGGVNFGFPSCQAGPRVLLFTITFFATSSVGETYLKIDRHTNPTSPNFQCPLVTACDVDFTKVCVTGGQAILNGRSCTVGVEPSSWSKVKGLYN